MPERNPKSSNEETEPWSRPWSEETKAMLRTRGTHFRNDYRSAPGEQNMRLMRNEGDRRGKYTVIDNRTGEICQDEFFVLKLKDVHTAAALRAYAADVFMVGDDKEYAQEVWALAKRAARMPNRKLPD